MGTEAGTGTGLGSDTGSGSSSSSGLFSVGAGLQARLWQLILAQQSRRRRTAVTPAAWARGFASRRGIRLVMHGCASLGGGEGRRSHASHVRVPKVGWLL